MPPHKRAGRCRGRASSLDFHWFPVKIGQISDVRPILRSLAREARLIEIHSGLKPLPKSDRAQSVMTAMADFIAPSGFRPGVRLPAERQFMEGLAVGRSTVREVIRQLQALGIVESRKGSGTYLLRSVSADTIHVPLSINTTHLRDALLQTLDVRRGSEVEASALAALRHTPKDLKIIEGKLEEMEAGHYEKGTDGRGDRA